MAAKSAPKDTGSSGWELKKTFAFLCVMILCMVVFYLPIYLTNNNQIAIMKGPLNVQPPIQALLATNDSPNVSGDEAVYQRYLEIRQAYNTRLSSIPLITFKPSEMFIDYGEPVKKYLPKNSAKIKRILMWTGFFGNMSFVPSEIECSNTLKCEATYDRKELLNCDAIMIHARDMGGINNLPAERLPHQRWVHFVMESPYHLGLSPASFNGVFNYTLTYRFDSDARVNYFSLFKRETPLLKGQYATLLTEIMSSKSKLISYMNSNCGASHTKRLSYLDELTTHIPVDMYGACGTLTCLRYTSECTKTMSSYKFYLSLENSHCRNYVTEKAGEPLFDWRAVPIVMGGADPSDYERALPRGSYINTAGFDSPKELAEYLLILDKSPALYERYHEWRKNYTGEVNFFNEAWCNLCRQISNDSLPVQTYRDFKGWYDQDTCHI